MSEQALDIAPGAIVEVRDKQSLVSAVRKRALSISEPQSPLADVLTHQGHMMEIVLELGQSRLRSQGRRHGVVIGMSHAELYARGWGILVIAFRYALEQMQNKLRSRCAIIDMSLYYSIILKSDIRHAV